MWLGRAGVRHTDLDVSSASAALLMVCARRKRASQRPDSTRRPSGNDAHKTCFGATTQAIASHTERAATTSSDRCRMRRVCGEARPSMTCQPRPTRRSAHPGLTQRPSVTRPHTDTERRATHESMRARTAYLWSVEPSRVCDGSRSRLVRAGGPELGRAQGGRRPVGDACGGILVGQGGVVVSDRVKGHGQPGFGPRVSRGGGSPLVGCLGIPSSRPRWGDMKPYGHDHRELTHLRRPHQWMGHADTSSCPMAVARLMPRSARQRISPSRSP